MPLPTIGGGMQYGPATSETVLKYTPTPATAAGTQTLTMDQFLNGLLLGSPGGTAAFYVLPFATDLDTTLPNAVVGHSFDFAVMNVNGSGTGVITMSTNTGWTLVGLMTVAATAGTSQIFRARKTGPGAWTLYRLG